MPRRVVVAFALCALLASAGAARAQAGDPQIRAVFDRLDPAVSGVTVTIRNAPPAPPLVTVRNDSGTQLEVSGIDFEPFVRIGPDGVSANRRSRTFYMTQDPTGSQSIPDEARPRAVPVWVKVSDANEWGWYEPRARWTAPVPPAVRTGNKDAVLGPWNLRARHGTTPVAIEGRMLWHPIRGSMRARLVNTTPAAVQGVRVTVLQGTIPALVVTNSSPRRIEIRSRDGVAFARVGPGGVDVNLSSATARDNPRFGQGSGWKHIQNGPVLSWLERRAAPPSDEPPASRIGVRTTMVRWTLDGTIDADPFAIRGLTEWVPIAGATTPGDGGDVVRWLVVAAVLTALTAAALLFARRRRGARRV